MTGKRKFIMGCGTLLLLFVSLWAGGLSGAQMVTLVPLVLGITVGGNVAEHVVAKFAKDA